MCAAHRHTVQPGRVISCQHGVALTYYHTLVWAREQQDRPSPQLTACQLHALLRGTEGSTAQPVDLRQREEARRGCAVLWFVLVRGDVACSSSTPRRARSEVFGIDQDVATGTPPARGCQTERTCYTLELVFMHGRRRCSSGRVVIAHAAFFFSSGSWGGGGGKIS